MDHADDGDDDDVFVYTGGDQEVPRDVKRVRIAENVDTILDGAFRDCQQLIAVEGHNKIRKIEALALCNCRSLRSVTKMQGVIEIENMAFYFSQALSDVEFDKLEIIGLSAFDHCDSLRSIKMSSVRRVRQCAFQGCDALTDAVFGKDLERIETLAFWFSALRRITIPLKDNLIIEENAFNYCENLSSVDVVVGGIHETISSLHMKTWINEIEDEINSINQTLPDTPATEKSEAIQQWITSVLSRMEYYKGEHQALLKEAMTLLELALWKAKLLNQMDEKMCNVDFETTKAKIDAQSARKENRVTCGASIVIKNVLPFLVLK